MPRVVLDVDLGADSELAPALGDQVEEARAPDGEVGAGAERQVELGGRHRAEHEQPGALGELGAKLDRLGRGGDREPGSAACKRGRGAGTAPWP